MKTLDEKRDELWNSYKNDICPYCKCEILKEKDLCKFCYGSGKSDDLTDFLGCLSCNGNGEVTTYHCECDPMDFM